MSATLFFCPSIRPAFIPPASICLPSYYLLLHWMEFNQTCYMTFPPGKGMGELHYFSVCPFACPSITLSPPKPLGGINQTCYMTFPRGKGVREQHHFSFLLCLVVKVWGFVMVCHGLRNLVLTQV